MDLTHQQDSTGAWTWLLPDGLGSVRSMVNANNMPVDVRQFTPYGEPISLMGSTATISPMP